MKTETFVAGNYGKQTYSSAGERWAEQRRLVGLVATAYTVVAFNPDEEARSRTNKWSVQSCHFKVDAENAVRRTIERRPAGDQLKLGAAWDNILFQPDNLGARRRRAGLCDTGPEDFSGRVYQDTPEPFRSDSKW